MTVCTAWPRMMAPELARDYVGGRAIFEAMKKAGLIKVKIKSPPRYDKILLDNACDKLPAGFTASSRKGKSEEGD